MMVLMMEEYLEIIMEQYFDFCFEHLKVQRVDYHLELMMVPVM